MLTDLMELGRLESGAFELQIQPVLMSELVSRVVTRVNGEQHRTRVAHKVSYSVEPQELELRADSRRLEQVLTDLLTNAFRYSPDGGQIRVLARWEPQTGEVFVSVTDSGVGIPPEERAQIFEHSFRGARGRKLAAQGLGLGLYVGKRLIQAHGGEIGVEDGPNGRGSTFWFTLPINAGPSS
jgi:signal transduction histidine kinase